MSSGAQSYLAFAPANPQDPKAIPANADGEKINFTKDDLSAGIGTTQSNHIRPDRMTTDVTITSMEVGGGYEYEMHFEADKDDKLIAAALWSSWQDLVKGTPGPVDISGGTLTKATGILDLSSAAVKPDNLVAGVAIKISGTANNDGIYRATPVVNQPDQYKLTPNPNADETIPANATMSGQWIKNGAEYHPMFFERGHVDVNEYFQFFGMAANTWKIDIPEQGLVTASYGFVGFTSKVVQTPTFQNYTDPSTNPSMSSVTNVSDVMIDGAPVAACLLQKVSIEINNNVTAKTGIGVFGACGTTAHKLEIGGAFTMYFNDSGQYDKLLKGTEFSFGLTLTDNDGNTYVIDHPRCKLSEDKINVTGGDDDVMDDAAFVALADNATQSMIIISRFPKS